MFPRGVVSPCSVVTFYSTGVCDTGQEVSGTFSKTIQADYPDGIQAGAGCGESARCLRRHYLQPPALNPKQRGLVASNARESNEKDTATARPPPPTPQTNNR